MTYGEWRVSQGRTSQCAGTTLVIPVPIHMTVEDAIAEQKAMGQLVEPPAADDDVEWAHVRCPGGDGCWCQHGLLDPNYRETL